jgi:hypothetical protein
MGGIVDVVAMVVFANGMDDEYDEYNDAAMTSRRRTMGRTRAAAVGWRGGEWQCRRGDGRDHDVAWTPGATRRCRCSTRASTSIRLACINFPRGIDECVDVSILCYLEDGANKFVRNKTMMSPPRHSPSILTFDDRLSFWPRDFLDSCVFFHRYPASLLSRFSVASEYIWYASFLILFQRGGRDRECAAPLTACHR